MTGMIAAEGIDLAAVITAVGVAVGAITASIISAVTAVRSLRKTEAVKRGVEEVHVLVDGRLSTVLARVEQLTTALEGSDTEVPPEPHVNTTADHVAQRAIDVLEEPTNASRGHDTNWTEDHPRD